MDQKASVFDKLITGLSADERTDMLRRIQTDEPASEEPLFVPDDGEEAESLEAHYSQLGIIQRIMLFLKSFFRQKDIMEVLEESILEGYARDIQSAHPGLYDFRTNTLGASFARLA